MTAQQKNKIDILNIPKLLLNYKVITYKTTTLAEWILANQEQILKQWHVKEKKFKS